MFGGRHPYLKPIVAGGILAGAFDIVYAFIFYGMRGIPPVRILQSIASGLLGEASYSGGLASASLGLVLHFLILIAAATVFWWASRRVAWLIGHAVVSGALFALCIRYAAAEPLRRIRTGTTVR